MRVSYLGNDACHVPDGPCRKSSCQSLTTHTLGVAEGCRWDNQFISDKFSITFSVGKKKKGEELISPLRGDLSHPGDAGVYLHYSPFQE